LSKLPAAILYNRRDRWWSRRRQGLAAGRKEEKAMHELKQGTLKSGASGKTVKSRKQAIAIGISVT